MLHHELSMTTPQVWCADVVRLVSDYVDGELAADERLAFERHVIACPPCRAHLAQLRATLRATGEVDEHDLDPALARSLVAAFRDWRGASPE
jgi:anti-sigma factor RsiW